jgi:hypothetical protein
VKCFVHDKKKAIDLAHKEGATKARLQFQDGTQHALHANGVQVRVTPKVRGKAAHKALKRERRMMREQDAVIDSQMARA